MKYLGKGDSPESIVTKQRLEETISERIAAIPKAGADTPGLLSSEDYSKLKGIEPSANFYTHPTAHPISFITGLQATLDAKAPAAHSHTIANITNLQTTLDSKASASHGHTIADTIDLQEELDSKAEASHLHTVGDVTGLQATLDGKVDDSQVLTNVPLNAKFTDTITTINSKTGAITKADIVALGIPAQDTVVDISGKADKTYVDNKVKTDVPVGAKFTDTVYTHPTTAGNKHIPTGGASGQVLKYSASGTATWQADNDTITTINGKTGAISKADIVALGIPSQDTVYTHPTTHSISEISGLQTALDGKVGALPNATESTAGMVKVYYGEGETAPYAVLSVGSIQHHMEYVEANLANSINSKADIRHNHNIDNVTGLQTALDGKVDDSQVLTNVPLNAKFTDTVTTINGKTGAISKADITALGIPSQDTNTTYSEITTAEIDTGTASTLRTITARRLKYLLDKIVALFPTKTSELTNDSGFLTSVTKSDVGLGNVDNIKQMPISGGVLENYREKLVTLSGTSTAINLSLGNVFTHTLASNTTYSITNAVNGQAHSFTLIINQTSTVRTLTFPASVKWQDGEIPVMSTANKTYVLTFMTVNGGTTWLGVFGGEF